MSLAEANEFVANFHRHNKPVQGAKFALGASDGQRLIGVAIVGRPVARRLDDGVTAEVTRCCVLDDAPKGACSFLYSRAWRAWQAIGGQRLVTYTLHLQNQVAARRLGFWLELLALGNEELLSRLEDGGGHSYAWLEPSGPTDGPCNTRWRLIINVPERQLLEWREH